MRIIAFVDPPFRFEPPGEFTLLTQMSPSDRFIVVNERKVFFGSNFFPLFLSFLFFFFFFFYTPAFEPVNFREMEIANSHASRFPFEIFCFSESPIVRKFRPPIAIEFPSECKIEKW